MLDLKFLSEPKKDANCGRKASSYCILTNESKWCSDGQLMTDWQQTKDESRSRNDYRTSWDKERQKDFSSFSRHFYTHLVRSRTLTPCSRVFVFVLLLFQLFKEKWKILVGFYFMNSSVGILWNLEKARDLSRAQRCASMTSYWGSGTRMST